MYLKISFIGGALTSPFVPLTCKMPKGTGTNGDKRGQMGTNGDKQGQTGTNGDKWGHVGTPGDM